MNLIIFGATGKTGLEITQQALDAGHNVTAFVRDASRLSIQHEHLTPFVGDVLNADQVTASLENQDAAVCALGSGNNLGKTGVRPIGTQNIIQGMQEHSVGRLLVVSAMGTGSSWEQLSFFNKAIYALFMKNVRAEHEEQETAVKASQLDWTIIRPSGLTDNPMTGVYDVGEVIKAKTSRIARADVAHLIINTLQQTDLIGKAITITN